MYWLIFLILSFLCAILNPYVGLFGILFLAEFEAFWFFDENIQRAAKFAASYVEKSESKYYEMLKKSGKGLLNLWCVLAVLFFVLMTVLSLIVWVFASGGLSGTAREMTPFVLFSEERKLFFGRMLLIAEIIFHFITMLLVFARRSSILKMPKDIKPWSTIILKEENPNNRVDHIQIKMGMFPMLLILLAGIVGMLNEYFGWMSFLVHFIYLIQIVVIEMAVGVILRLVKKNEKVKQGVQYFFNYVLDGTPYYYFVLGAVWIAAALIVALQLYLSLGYKNDIFMIFSLDAGMPAMIISCIAELLAAVLISRNILSRRIKGVKQVETVTEEIVKK